MPNRDPPQGLADLHDLVALLTGERADDELPALAPLEQAFLLEQLEGLPHGGLRNTERLGDLRIHDHGPRREVAAQDPITEEVVRTLASGRTHSEVLTEFRNFFA